jgi:SnoaL-like domain
LFAENAELCAPGTEPRHGRDAVEGYYRTALKPYPRHLDEPTRVLMSEKAATVEIHFSGALASGIPLEFDAVDVFDFDDDGLIVRLTSWYDSHAVRSSLKPARESMAPAP